jgi:hypothetical protein
METATRFKVIVRGFGSSVEEYQRARLASRTELPELSPAQREMAERFGVKEDDYKRGYLAGLYGERRMQEKGRKLGELTEETLSGLAPYRLRAVIGDMFEETWVLRVQKGVERILNVQLEREFVDDTFDAPASPSESDKALFRSRILQELGVKAAEKS